MNEELHPEGDASKQQAAEISALRFDAPLFKTKEAQDSSTHLVLFTLRAIYLGLLLAITVVIFLGDSTSHQQVITGEQWNGVISVMIFGAIIVGFDILTPDKKLASIFSILVGLIAGLLVTVAVGELLDLIAISWTAENESTSLTFQIIKIAIGISIIYLCISIVLTTKDSFRLVVPYIEFTKQSRGSRPLLLDSSAFIDSRIEPLISTGMIEMPIIAPEFVLTELQTLADSNDSRKRAKGRRGLATAGRLQQQQHIQFSVDKTDFPTIGVDNKLIELAAYSKFRIVTTDYNLEKLARIKNIPVLNLNALSHSLRPQAMPGEQLQLTVVRVGEEPSQGIGYLPDGTMVVIDGAGSHVGQSIIVNVSNTLQTSMGQMVFAEYGQTDQNEAQGTEASIPEEKTKTPQEQPPIQKTPPTQPRTRGKSGRNPRR